MEGYRHPSGGEAVRSLTVTFLEMWNAVSDKDKNDSDFTGFLVQTDYQAKQTGFIQPYADSPMDHEQVGEEVYISMVNKAEKYCWFMTPYLIITDEMSTCAVSGCQAWGRCEDHHTRHSG